MRLLNKVFILLAWVNLFTVQADDLIDQKIQELVVYQDNWDKVDTSWIRDSIRPVVIHRLRAKQVYSVLLLLGDEQTAEELSVRFLQKDGQAETLLQCYGDESALGSLIKVIRSGSTEQRGEGRRPQFSIRDQASSIFSKIISRSNNFPDTVRHWANHIPLFITGCDKQYYEREVMPINNRGMNQILIWWEHNKEAVLAHRYGEAMWLPSKEKVSTLSDTSPSSGSPTDAVKSESKPLLAQVAPSRDSGWELPIVLSIIIATALAGGFWLYRFAYARKP